MHSLPHRLTRALAICGHALFLLGSLSAKGQVGGFDPSFNAGPIFDGTSNGVVHANITTSAGDHIIAGQFTSVGGVPRGYIAKLSKNGSLDQAFGTGVGANGPIYAMALDSNGRILIGGDFNSSIGQIREEDAKIMGRYTKGSRVHEKYENGSL